MKRMTVRVPDTLVTRLNLAARKHGTTRSAVVRDALEAYLGQFRPAAASCLDVVADLVGTGAGPADLASNRRHLRGYGR